MPKPRRLVAVADEPFLHELHSRAATEERWVALDLERLYRVLPPSTVKGAIISALDDAPEDVIVLTSTTSRPNRELLRWLRDSDEPISVLVASADKDRAYLPGARVSTAETMRDLDAWWRLHVTRKDDTITRRSMVSVPVAELRVAITHALTDGGLDGSSAGLVTDDLLSAELAGYPSHGVSRVLEYHRKLSVGLINANAAPNFYRVGDGRFVLDADYAAGAVVKRWVRDFIEARGEPVVLLAIRKSGHLGRLASLAADIASADRIALGFANGAGGAQKVVPFGGTDARLSTNPIVFGAPLPGGHPLVVDVSTSALSDGQVQVAAQSGDLLPNDILRDWSGKAPRSPRRYVSDAAVSLQPLGGARAGNKGYALALAAEILTGVWGGGGFSQPAKRSVGNSALIVAARLDAMGQSQSAFLENMGRLASYVRSSPPVDRSSPVRLPGEGRDSQVEQSAVVMPEDLWHSIANLGCDRDRAA